MTVEPTPIVALNADEPDDPPWWAMATTAASEDAATTAKMMLSERADILRAWFPPLSTGVSSWLFCEMYVVPVRPLKDATTASLNSPMPTGVMPASVARPKRSVVRVTDLWPLENAALGPVDGAVIVTDAPAIGPLSSETWIAG